jgi:hypothetical protein
VLVGPFSTSIEYRRNSSPVPSGMSVEAGPIRTEDKTEAKRRNIASQPINGVTRISMPAILTAPLVVSRGQPPFFAVVERARRRTTLRSREAPVWLLMHPDHPVELYRAKTPSLWPAALTR